MNIYVKKNFKIIAWCSASMFLFVNFWNYIYSWVANMFLKLHVNFCNIITLNVIEAETVLLKKKLSNFIPQRERWVKVLSIIIANSPTKYMVVGLKHWPVNYKKHKKLGSRSTSTSTLCFFQLKNLLFFRETYVEGTYITSLGWKQNHVTKNTEWHNNMLIS